MVNKNIFSAMGYDLISLLVDNQGFSPEPEFVNLSLWVGASGLHCGESFVRNVAVTQMWRCTLKTLSQTLRMFDVSFNTCGPEQDSHVQVHLRDFCVLEPISLPASAT